MKKAISEKTDRLWDAVNRIRDNYLEEEKHMLICGKNALEIEKLFTERFKAHEDAIFEHLREMINEIKISNGK
jgi:hypothetical protein